MAADGIGDVSDDEVQRFIEDNGLNQRAADILLEATPAIRRAVLSQGSLASCRDPNAGCIGRVRKAQNSAPVPAQFPPALDEVEQFIGDNGLEARAAESLRLAPPQVQRTVLDQGSLHSCRDPNAGCIGRLNRAQRDGVSHLLPGAPPAEASPEEVDAFIEDNQLNDRASEALRSIPPAVQRQILDQGSLRGCREPSAGCIGRIAKIQKSGEWATGSYEAPSHAELKAFIYDNELDVRAAEVLSTAAPHVQRAVLDQGSLRTCRDPNAGCIGRIHRAQTAVRSPPAPRSQAYSRPVQHVQHFSDAGPTPEDIEWFITDNDLNERSAEALRGASATVQRSVLEQGSLQGCREPSAGCIGRIAKVQREISNGSTYAAAPSFHGRQVQQPAGASPREVEAFIAENELNERAAEALRGVSSTIQRIVLEQGPLRGCRDVNAGCIGRLAKAQKNPHLPTQSHWEPQVQAPAFEEVESFILENDLNDRASEALRTCDPAVQRSVLDQGSLRGCRETSAGCIGRIAKAGKAMNASSWVEPAPPPATAWQRGPPPGQSQPRRRTEQVQLEFVAPHPEEVEQFIIDNELNERASEILRSVPAAVQRQVLDQGSLQGCREPSAGCIGRVHKIQTEGTVATPRGSRFAEPTQEELQAFIEENELGERATGILLEVPPIVQRSVLDQGSLSGCRDTSAGLIGRVKKAQIAMKDGSLAGSGPAPPSSWGRGGPMVPAPRSGAAHALREALAEDRQRGSKRHWDHGSSRVQPVADQRHYAPPRSSSWGGGPPRGGAKQLHRLIEDFILEFSLSERAAGALREVSPEVQELVLQGGTLAGCRDYSAGCMGRIRKAQEQVQAQQHVPQERPGKRARQYEASQQSWQAVPPPQERGYDKGGKGWEGSQTRDASKGHFKGKWS
eukprot:TRINITY_DN21276_c0_g1_i1.p1 TRINITY_DN21276_c0_g1~~TRINITY_DN21276_c0_g1_i1.p1  ORF type:complete len:905 (+),score=178.73 TRINITY_DN21276_c0_g1_i1:64-2778(+)